MTSTGKLICEKNSLISFDSLKYGHCYKFCVILRTVNKEYVFYKMVVELIHISYMNGYKFRRKNVSI